MASELWPYFDAAGFSSRRSAVHSSKGIVSCSQPLAAACGIKILEQGGNCADAAVAVAAAQNVTEPAMSGVGGDMFCLFFDAKSKTVKAINGSGRSPALLTREAVRRDLGVPEGVHGKIPANSAHAVTVPGTVAGWLDTITAFGSGNVTMKQILAPAIALANDGFPIAQCASRSYREDEADLKRNSPNGIDMLKKDPKAEGGYRAPKTGEYMKNPLLANVFRAIAEDGKAGFYTGQTAEEIVKALREKGSYMTYADLKHHMDQEPGCTKPVSLKFSGQGIASKRNSPSMSSGVELWEHAPNGQGIVALMTLGILQILERQGKIKTFTMRDHNSPEYIHAIVECLRIAFADANWYIADPDYAAIRPEHLLSETYLTERAKLFNPSTASRIPIHGSPALSSSDTAYFCVTDSEGNAISFISSLYSSLGAHIVPANCGFALQNRGSGFVLGPSDHPNVLAPEKRPYHTIIPAMITNVSDGSLYAVYGVMGGYMQPQSQVQVLLDMCALGMNPQMALDAPRVVIQANDDDSLETDMIVSIEEGVDETTVARLREMGHVVKIVKGPDRENFGVGQAILRVVDPVDGVATWTAGSDPRGDGQAIPHV